MAEIRLDVSDLEPCEPLERSLSALAALKPGEWLRILHRREPFPLYDILQKQAFCWETKSGNNSAFEIIIWRCDDTIARTDIQRLTD